MARSSESPDDDVEDIKASRDSDISSAEAALKAKLSRKRTKTGCLTCRRRRIKCGEERPVCGNCIKSKRHCEGYNQRVIFKPPQYDYRPAPHGGAHVTFQVGPIPGFPPPYQPTYLGNGYDPTHHTNLRPRQVEQGPPVFHDTFPQQQQYPQGTTFVLNGPPTPMQHMPTTAVYQQPQHGHIAPPQQPFQVREFRVSEAQYPQGGTLPAVSYHPPMALPTTPLSHPPMMFPTTPQHHPPMALPSAPQHVPSMALPTMAQYHPEAAPMSQPQYAHSAAQMHTPIYEGSPTGPPPSYGQSYSYERRLSVQAPAPEVTAPYSWTSDSQGSHAELGYALDYQHIPFTSQQAQPPPYVTSGPASQPLDGSSPMYLERETAMPPPLPPPHILTEAAVESLDDDYYDIDSDDIDSHMTGSNYLDGRQRLGQILHQNQIAVQDLQTRRYDTFLNEGIVEQYVVEQHANPLRNPATARVFAHFIAVTGPSLSIFERHPRNTSVLFTEGNVPSSQQGLWTYTMPMAALHHQGLLHAMLALASLHIARLTGASTTPSMQHYMWALKRVHHCVGHPKKRLKITTIAASMLLGFYEILTADHMKWNTHLAGTRLLFVETDFVTMTRQARRIKRERVAQQQLGRLRRPSMSGFGYEEGLDELPDVDERVVSHLVGREVRYEDHGHILTHQSSVPHELDLGKFEILKDLYWWYCKQDVYQSIVSGNPLLMGFSRWTDCAPRAPLGRADAVYGTFDHLILLLARIADFSSRDRARKLRQMEANGGYWRPAAGMKMPASPTQPHQPVQLQSQSYLGPTGNGQATFGPPSHGTNGQGSAQFSAAPAPAFYGMAPPPRQNVQVPSSYAPLDGRAPTPMGASLQDQAESIDLHIATSNALEEYGRIRAALRTFATSLGDTFEPLASEYQPSVDTPFGAALFYRSYDIGCLWAVYNMAMIVAIRSHPHMPPAAHMAVGVAAQETASYANDIGRIAAGIAPGLPSEPLNPALGSALCESCMPSFFAAVQYVDPRQRHDTVVRIYGIAQRTGWGSAELIANGCETAWVKAAAAGRGPYYERMARPQQSDDPRLNGSWERLDPHVMPSDDDEGDRRLISTNANARLNWAIGIMGTESDMQMQV